MSRSNARGGGVRKSVLCARISVTGVKLHKNAVTASEVKDHSLLAKDFKAGQLAAEGAAGGDLTGSYPDPSIAPAAVTNSKLANPALTINPGTGLTGGGGSRSGARSRSASIRVLFRSA